MQERYADFRLYISGSLLLDHTMHAFVDGEIGILCNHSYTNANAN